MIASAWMLSHYLRRALRQSTAKLWGVQLLLSVPHGAYPESGVNTNAQAWEVWRCVREAAATLTH
jgi:hypothetical protein